MLVGILSIIGVGLLIGSLIYGLIYCLGKLIWGAMTWEDK